MKRQLPMNLVHPLLFRLLALPQRLDQLVQGRAWVSRQVRILDRGRRGVGVCFDSHYVKIALPGDQFAAASVAQHL